MSLFDSADETMAGLPGQDWLSGLARNRMFLGGLSILAGDKAEKGFKLAEDNVHMDMKREDRADRRLANAQARQQLAMLQQLQQLQYPQQLQHPQRASLPPAGPVGVELPGQAVLPGLIMGGGMPGAPAPQMWPRPLGS